MHLRKQFFFVTLLGYSFSVVKSQECHVSGINRSGNLDVPSLNDTFGVGDSIRVNCHVGYVGFKRFKCTETGWEASGRGCELKPCGHPGDTQNGDFTLSEREDFVFGAEVTYTCNEGFQMASRRPTRTCLAGGWDNFVPTCEVVKCPDIPMDQIDQMKISGNTENPTYGDVIQFECQSQHMIINGSSEIYCTSEGNWSSAIPRCEDWSCPAPEKEKNNAIFHSGRKEVYTRGDTVSYHCRDGYKAKQTTAICRYGTWDYPHCTRKEYCDRPQRRLIKFSPEKDKYKNGEFLEYRCLEPYTMTPAGRVTCENGEWKGSLECKSQTCPLPPHVENAEYVETDHSAKVVTEVSYKCALFYTLSHSRTIRCQNGQWETPPVCLRPCEITKIDSLYNLKDPKDKVYVQHERTHKLECKDGYYYESSFWKTVTTVDVKCLYGVVEYEICKPYSDTHCATPDNEINNAILQSKTKDMYASGDMVSYHCKEGYEADYTTAKCRNGHWDYPHCVGELLGVTCPSPPALENGEYRPLQSIKNTPIEVSYKCALLFTLIGPWKIKCRNGQWESPPQCLRPCEISNIDPKFNLKDPERKLYISHGEKHTLKCKEGYYYKYKFLIPNIKHVEVECINGKIEYETCAEKEKTWG